MRCLVVRFLDPDYSGSTFLRNVGEILPDGMASHPIRTSNPTRCILVERVFLGYQLWVLFVYENDVTQLKVELAARSFIVSGNITLVLSAIIIERGSNLRCCKKPQIFFPDSFTWMELSLFSYSLKKVTTLLLLCVLTNTITLPPNIRCPSVCFKQTVCSHVSQLRRFCYRLLATEARCQ